MTIIEHILLYFICHKSISYENDKQNMKIVEWKTYYHPDCVIFFSFLFARAVDNVKYNISD